MANFTKTANIQVLALQSVASNSVAVSSAQDVSTLFGATIFISFGRRTTGALASGMTFRVESSPQASGDTQWLPMVEFTTGAVAAESEAVSGTVNSGQKVVTLASTSNLAVGQILFIDNTTIANSEWIRVAAVSTNTSVTAIDNLTNAQTGATVYNQGEFFVAQLDLTAVVRLRVVADGSNTGQAVAVQAYMVTGDSIS